MELNPPQQSIRLISTGPSDLMPFLIYTHCPIYFRPSSFFIHFYSNKLFIKPIPRYTDICYRFKFPFESSNHIIKNMNPTKPKQPFQNQQKNHKVLNNLSKIRSLVQEALFQLKQSSRISTNQSDSSESLSPVSIRRRSVCTQKGEVQKYLESLEKGYVMVKHSLSTKPKEKYIYVSSDRRFLCWKSLDKDDEKRVELKKVNLILKGSNQTLSHVQRKSVRELERFIIIRWERRDLELEAFNDVELIKFSLQISEAVRYAKGIHMCYNL